MRRVATVVTVALGCAHSQAMQWNREHFVRVAAPATEATTHEPLYAEARPGFADAMIYPGFSQLPRSERDPKAETAFRVLTTGSECGEALAAGSVDPVWNRFTDEARREHKDRESFRKIVESTLARLGKETRVRGEYVVATPKGVSYLRDSEWSNAPKGMVLELAFAPDSTSEISGLALYRSETRPIVVKVGEAANAGR